ncbi:hypothetical protein [uncultured Merdimonas sp.]|uniref:hypothetical protein n=1 Tax=uncultured Merdimonas sp. TaxID=2023269 RepID=UPI003209557B
MEETTSKRKTKKWIILALVCVIALIGVCIWYFQFKRPHDIAVEDFNDAAAAVTEQNTELENTIADAQSILDSGEPPYDSATTDALTTAIADATAEMRDVPDIPDKTEDIINATNELLKPLDYSDTISDITAKQEALEISITQLKQVTNPSQDFIIQRLQDIDGVTGYQAVTEDHDPNGNLNKQGGYTAAVYFSSSAIDQNAVYGSDIVEKGTEGGGCVEVYASTEDAESRNTYLSAFDGAGFLDPGSHTVVGTVIIRTSSKLTATQQTDLTQKITDKLIEVQ